MVAGLFHEYLFRWLGDIDGAGVDTQSWLFCHVEGKFSDRLASSGQDCLPFSAICVIKSVAGLALCFVMSPNLNHRQLLTTPDLFPRY